MLTLKAEIIKNNPMIKKKALVIIKGGLGNQLFQLSLCNKLRALGYDVYIDYSFYFNKEWMLNNTKRELELDLENLDFKIATKKTLSIFYNLQKLRPISNYQKGHNLNISNTKFLNIFDGYWQTVENLEFSIDYVVNLLSTYPKFSNYLNNNRKKGSTLVHIRRTDYVELSQELSLQYYVDALNLAKSKVNNFYYDIFTDDVEWVSENELFKDARNVFDRNSFGGSSLDTFLEMLDYENYIISNSTFSFLAAFMGKRLNSTLIKPYPWFHNREHNFDNITNWINIDWKYI